MRTGLAITAAIIAALLTAAAPAPSAPTIHDCASFRTWFHQQPGYALTLEAGRYDEKAPAPRAGSDRLTVHQDEMSYYKGHYGGGGCVGAFYDARLRRAAFVDRYDSAMDVGETVVTAMPAGIRSGRVSAATSNGVRLGMTRRAVEAIEGRGRALMRGADVVLRYSWSVPSTSTPVPAPAQPGPMTTFSPELFSVAFLLRGDRVIAMDYFAGY